MKDIDQISGDVLDVSIRLHRELGPGLLESVYETVLAGRLADLGYNVVRQQLIDIEFEGRRFEAAFRVDLVVDHRLLVEIKSTDRLHAAHMKQMLTCLRLTKQPVGLLINFGGATLKEGFKHLVNDYHSSASLRSLRLCENESADVERASGFDEIAVSASEQALLGSGSSR